MRSFAEILHRDRNIWFVKPFDEKVIPVSTFLQRYLHLTTKRSNIERRIIDAFGNIALTNLYEKFHTKYTGGFFLNLIQRSSRSKY